MRPQQPQQGYRSQPQPQPQPFLEHVLREGNAGQFNQQQHAAGAGAGIRSNTSVVIPPALLSGNRVRYTHREGDVASSRPSLALVPVSSAGTAPALDYDGDEEEEEEPSDEMCEEFKSQVKTWMELDNIVKKLQEMLGKEGLQKPTHTENSTLHVPIQHRGYSHEGRPMSAS